MLPTQPQQLRKLLYFVFVLLVPYPPSTHAVLYDAFNNPNECTGSEYQLCGCQAIPNEMISEVETLLSQPLGCVQYCGQQTCEETCAQSVCSYPMGNQGELCTTTVLSESMISYVRNSECSFDEGMLTYKCTKGSSVAYPDTQTYNAITKGFCVPACNLQTEKFKCDFNPMFRDETHIDPADLPIPPFIQIFGVPFTELQHVPGETGTTPTVTDPETAVGEDGTDSVSTGDETKATDTVDTSSGDATQTSSVDASGKPAADTDDTAVSSTTGSGVGDVTTDTSTSAGSEDTAVSSTTGSGVGDAITDTSTSAGSDDTRVSSTMGSGVGDTTTDTSTSAGSDDIAVSSTTGSGVGDTTTDTSTSAGSDDTRVSSTTGSGVGDAITDADSDPGSTLKTVPIFDFGSEDVEATPASTTIETKSSEVQTPDDPDAPPSEAPIEEPMAPPSETPIEEPTAPPSEAPIEEPTAPPSETPIEEPTAPPSETPIEEPTAPPSETPIEEPTAPPSETPIEEPEAGPDVEPSEPSDEKDIKEPITEPTVEPAEEFPASTNNFTLYYGPYGECPQVCGEAGDHYKERSITCRNPAGIPAELNLCTLPEDLPNRYLKKCQNPNCGPEFFIDLKSWSSCPNKCAEVRPNGKIIENTMTRDYTCKRVTDNSIVDQENCDDLLGDFSFDLEKKCNSIPCSRYGYDVSEWGACSCETFKQERSVTCRSWTTGSPADVSICEQFGLEKPPVERVCLPKMCSPTTSSRKLLQQEEFDFCAYTDCSAKGDCENGKCSCKSGFDGMDCQIDDRTNSKCPLPSLLNGKGDCCNSGIFDLSGKCCDGVNSETEIDIDGNCCAGKPLDGCGKCGGDEPHFQDGAGNCCAALDASGTCCESGDVDECGVCDGYGESCNTTITLTVQVATDSDLDSCIREVTSIVADAMAIKEGPLDTHLRNPQLLGFSKIGVPMTTGHIGFRMRRMLETKQLTRPCAVDNVETAKVSVCGNQVCEIGETETCPKDCDYNIELCSTEEDLYGRLVMCKGHGQCSFVNTSSCNCNTGYTGPNCEDCEDGFFHLEADNRCIPGQAITNRPVTEIEPETVVPVTTVATRSASTEPRDGTAVTNSDDDLDVGLLIAIIGICLIVFVFFLVVLFIIRRSKQQDDKELSEEQELNPEVPEENPNVSSA